MEIIFTPDAKKDLEFWGKSGNSSVQNKITSLLKSMIETPFTGIGKPEPLKYNYTGLWSRRINREHRIVYEVAENFITILSLKGHYE
jgi:toxin YoeB